MSNPHQALRHAKIAQDTDLLATILSKHGWSMFNQGELEMLESSINKLCMLQAWLAQSQHRYNDVGALLSKADEEMAKLNVELSSKEQGEFNALRAQVAINQNEPEKALELAELASSGTLGIIAAKRNSDCSGLCSSRL